MIRFEAKRGFVYVVMDKDEIAHIRVGDTESRKSITTTQATTLLKDLEAAILEAARQDAILEGRD